MRGYQEQGKLVSEAIINGRFAGIKLDQEHRAELRIAGYGTFLGNWVPVKAVAENELNEMIGKHIPGGMASAGIPAYKPHHDHQYAGTL